LSEKTATIWTTRIVVAVYAVCLVVFAVGLVRSPVIDHVFKQERIVLNKHARGDLIDVERERRFAETYWELNPDVAASAFFGSAGALGIFGPREHYDRHGRSEGRAWGR